MPLQDTLDSIREKFESSQPDDVVRKMHRATDELRERGIMDGVITPGTRAPAFELPSPEGRVSLASLLEKGWLVLGFYRGVW